MPYCPGGNATALDNEPQERDGSTRDKLIATGRIRTDDLRFTKPLLCRLSYGGQSCKYPHEQQLRVSSEPRRNRCFADILTLTAPLQKR